MYVLIVIWTDKRSKQEGNHEGNIGSQSGNRPSSQLKHEWKTCRMEEEQLKILKQQQQNVGRSVRQNV